jgi:hypothetical protein
MFEEKDLVFGTFMDNGKASKIKGNTVCFVLAVDDADKLINQIRNKTFKKLAILSRKKVSKKFAEELLELMDEYRVPNKSSIYRLKPLLPHIENFNKMAAYKPKSYKTLKTSI